MFTYIITHLLRCVIKSFSVRLYPIFSYLFIFVKRTLFLCEKNFKNPLLFENCHSTQKHKLYSSIRDLHRFTFFFFLHSSVLHRTRQRASSVFVRDRYLPLGGLSAVHTIFFMLKIQYDFCDIRSF